MRRRRVPGFALAMALIIVALVAVVTFTAVNISTLDQRSSTQQLIATQAGDAARAGIAQSQVEIGPPGLTLNWPGTGSGTPTGPEVMIDKDCGYSVRVQYDSGAQRWKVTSTGYFRGAHRTIIGYLSGEPFSKYAYFTNRDVSSGGGAIWFTSSSLITGPAHTNGHFRIAGTPEWTSSVTSANEGDSRYDSKAGTYNQEGIQRDPAKFYETYSGYRYDYPIAAPGSHDFAFAGGQKDVPLPKSTDQIETAARAAGDAFSDSSHSYDSSKTYQIAVDPSDKSGKVTAVEVQGKYGWTKVSETSAPPVYKLVFSSDGHAQLYEKQVGSATTWNLQSTINTTTKPGVTIHVDGFLLIKGTVNGRVTVGATQDIHNIDNLVYSNKKSDVLGVVGQHNFIVDSDPNLRQDREIDGSIMTLDGCFTVNDYSSGRYRGKLTVLGGLIQKNRGPVGTFVVRNGVPSPYTGYSKDYSYDEKLTMRPPLNFPTTGKIILTQIIDQGAPGGV